MSSAQHADVDGDRGRGDAFHLKCRPNTLRHTCVARLLAEGIPASDVAAYVGHASTQMTLDVYGHAAEGRAKFCAETLRNALQIDQRLVSTAKIDSLFASAKNKKKPLTTGVKGWQRKQDLNLRNASQSRRCYRYTIPL